MKQVLKIYGKFMLEGIALSCVVYLWIYGSFFENIGAQLTVETMEYGSYTDFREIYLRESQKEVPQINYITGNITVGAHALAELIEAHDYAERELEIKIHSIINPKGEEQLNHYDEESENINFTMPGVYTIKVSAVDDGNRKSVCLIKIPVNK